MISTIDSRLSVDELSSGLRAQVLLTKLPTGAFDQVVALKSASKPVGTELSEVPKASQKNGTTNWSYDRWSLLDETTIDYGHCAQTWGKSVENVGGNGGVPLGSFYLTTAINYSNGPAHMGHAYEATTSDVLARFSRLKGNQQTYFLTGADEHGQKIAATAEDMGQSCIEMCDKYVTGFKCLNQRLLISNDDYVRTTSARHKRTAKALWEKCYKNGDIYLDTYEGWYNVREETFVTENEAAQNNYLDLTSGKPLKQVQEASYFFRMSKYQEKLLDYIQNVNPSFIQPSHHKNQILHRLKSDPLRDLSISRTSFSWGISVPEEFDSKHVMYVWIDALSNYLTGIDALGIEKSKEMDSSSLSGFWPANVHIIGKDILWFHTVIWPCLLMSTGLSLPHTVFAHGFVNDQKGEKMSKSLGNVIDPHDVLDRIPIDTFRWYLCKEAPYGGELAFSEASLHDMHNSDLCDTLGNLIHRATNLCSKYCGGKVPDVSPIPTLSSVLKQGGGYPDAHSWEGFAKDYVEKMDRFQLQSGAHCAMQGFRDINGYLTQEAPWLLKGDDIDTVKQRQKIVVATLEAIYVLSHLLLPFIPVGAKKIFSKLNTAPLPLAQLLSKSESTRTIGVGTTIVVGDVLYTKILSPEAQADAEKNKNGTKESYQEAQKRKKENKAQNVAASRKGQKCVSDPDQPEFTKTDIRVGKIVKVWHHEGADKLFCEQIDVGEGEPREIASGLRQFYKLEDLQDRYVLVVCNLKPAKMVGFLSNGMVLAAKSDDGVSVELIEPPTDAPVGERVFVEGLSGEPQTSTQMKKKKTWETIAKKLKTGKDAVATWNGKEILTSKGPCRASSLVGAPIS